MDTTTRSGSPRVPFVLLLALMILHKPAGLAQAFPCRSLLQTCQPNGSITGKSGKCNVHAERLRVLQGRPAVHHVRVLAARHGEHPGHAHVEQLRRRWGRRRGGRLHGQSGRFYNDSQKVAALSTGWFNGRSRCEKDIVIRASNGRSVRAMVVDECNSMKGCDEENNYEPPCGNNIVNGSPAVWDALGLNKDAGEVQITWSDA